MKIELVQIVFVMLMYLLLTSMKKKKRRQNENNKNISFLFLFFFNNLFYRKHTVDFEFQALLKRHFTRVMYFDATVMDPVDLERVKVIEKLFFKIIYLIVFVFLIIS